MEIAWNHHKVQRVPEVLTGQGAETVCGHRGCVAAGASDDDSQCIWPIDGELRSGRARIETPVGQCGGKFRTGDIAEVDIQIQQGMQPSVTVCIDRLKHARWDAIIAELTGVGNSRRFPEAPRL